MTQLRFQSWRWTWLATLALLLGTGLAPAVFGAGPPARCHASAGPAQLGVESCCTPAAAGLNHSCCPPGSACHCAPAAPTTLAHPGHLGPTPATGAIAQGAPAPHPCRCVLSAPRPVTAVSLPTSTLHVAVPAPLQTSLVADAPDFSRRVLAAVDPLLPPGFRRLGPARAPPVS
jgi:hypothetical protein